MSAEIDFDLLKDPFPAEDVEWRIQQSGAKNGRPWAMVLCYVTNRAIQERLDDVAGPHNWRNEYAAAPTGGVMCGISIRIGGEWVTKWDGAENTQVEAVKGGLSGAMKRAAVQWGIGRYLYKLDATFAECFADKQGRHKAKFQPRDGSAIFGSWNEPALPAWALPDQSLAWGRHVEKLTAKLDQCQTILALQKFWAGLNKDEHLALTEAKDAKKSELQGEAA